MPFDVLPQETQTEFQEFADALLKGCANTKPHYGELFCMGGAGACALGALWTGLGFGYDAQYAIEQIVRGDGELASRYNAMHRAYEERYGSAIWADNDRGRFTREQIAARIAAL
jgi:hypothetical protein